jgi:uncharacterized damage-inducible protein DinB
MTDSNSLHTLFSHKAWANDELFRSLIDADRPQRADAWHSARRVLNHIYVVDRIFVGNMQREPHGYAALNTPETPHLTDLHAQVRETDAWLIDYASSRTAAELDEPVDFVFVDGKPGRMRRIDMLSHVLTHGSYHRGAVGWIMGQADVAPPRDILTVFLHRPGSLPVGSR